MVGIWGFPSVQTSVKTALMKKVMSVPLTLSVVNSVVAMPREMDTTAPGNVGIVARFVGNLLSGV